MTSVAKTIQLLLPEHVGVQKIHSAKGQFEPTQVKVVAAATMHCRPEIASADVEPASVCVGLFQDRAGFCIACRSATARCAENKQTNKRTKQKGSACSHGCISVAVRLVIDRLTVKAVE